MSLGIPPEEHADRIPAWTQRLRSAVAARNRAIRKNDAVALRRAQEDVWFWIGRLTCDVLASGNDAAFAAVRRDAAAAIIEAGGQFDYGYPGVVGQRLPDTGTVNKARIDGKPYLCVSYEVEQRTVQPLRLAAGLVAAPLVAYAASQLPAERGTLRLATFATAAGIAYWSLWVWNKAHEAMKVEPD